MMDALTKYVELVPLQNKEATTIAEAIFDKWFCRFDAPLDLITDQSKEFCAKISDDLLKGLAPLTLPLCCTTLSVIAKQKLPIKQLQNIWQAFVVIPH
jgi:hypothetical protein